MNLPSAKHIPQNLEFEGLTQRLTTACTIVKGLKNQPVGWLRRLSLSDKYSSGIS
jgi:hypothetical protein